MKIKVFRRRSKAMTLVEVVVALAILTIIVAGVMMSFSFGFSTMKRVRHNQRATQILLEKLETIRLYSWTQVNTPGFIPSSFTDVYDPQGNEGQKGTTYYGTVELIPFSRLTNYRTNLKEVVLTLRWTDDRISHERKVRTFIGKNGLQNYVY